MMDANEGSDIEALEASSAASSNDITFTNRKLGKSVTLDLLVREGILRPEPKALTIKYMGRRFTGDLLANGQIQACDSGDTFMSPSAWAMYCKKQVNPSTRVSGCGWGTIRYKGQTLNVYKVMWLNKQASAFEESSHHIQVHSSTDHSEVGNIQSTDNRLPCSGDSQILLPIESIPLEAYNEHLDIAVACCRRDALTADTCRFRVHLSGHAMLVMAAHCHSQCDEVCGYLAGQDVSNFDGQKVLVIQEAFPFAKNGQTSDDELRGKIKRRGLRLCGWYHSHPGGQSAYPLLYDVECQQQFQRSLTALSDWTGGHQSRTCNAALHPSVSFVLSPYATPDTENVSMKNEDFSKRFQCFYISEEKMVVNAAASRRTAAEVCGYPYSVDQLALDMTISSVSNVRLHLENLLRGCTDGPARTLKYVTNLAHAYGNPYLDDVKKLLSEIVVKSQADQPHLMLHSEAHF